MAEAIYMPKNGMDMTEGTIVRWLKNVGDPVEKDEPIMEIETDKVTMESESPVSGILLKQLYHDGDVVPVLTTVGYVGAEGEQVPDDGRITAQAADRRTADNGSRDGYDYQIAVIGGGPAGYVAAIRGAQLGASVVLFEKDTVGGTCLNRGCIPTKTLLKTAEYLHNFSKAAERGIHMEGSLRIEMPEIIANKNRVVKTLTDGVRGLLKSNGVEVVQGEAILKSGTEIACAGKTYRAEKVILCGGSGCVRIPIPGIENKGVLTSTEILDLEQVPSRLCIIGGGVIGCEFASAFQEFGAQVTIVEQADRLVPMMDADISAEIARNMKNSGIQLRLHEKILEIRESGGELSVVLENGEILCDKVLLSIGRVPDLHCLGEMKDRIRTQKGRIVVDDTMKTSVDGIYACGDVNGRSMLAHSAFKMGETAAENCVKNAEKKCELNVVPSVLYTIPEAASVGMTEAAAREAHPEGVRVGIFPLSANSRSVASGEKAGFVKVIADSRYGEILGVHIVGSDAAEMIAEPAALMAAEVTVQEAADRLIHAHPSYGEAFGEACGQVLGRCIHLPAKKRA